jgi:hypothetical protein
MEVGPGVDATLMVTGDYLHPWWRQAGNPYERTRSAAPQFGSKDHAQMGFRCATR